MNTCVISIRIVDLNLFASLINFQELIVSLREKGVSKREKLCVLLLNPYIIANFAAMIRKNRITMTRICFVVNLLCAVLALTAGCTKSDRSEEEQKLKNELQVMAFTTPDKAFARTRRGTCTRA